MPSSTALQPSLTPHLLQTSRAWLVRPGRDEAALQYFLGRGRVALGWGRVGDLSGAPDREAIKATVMGSPHAGSPQKVGNTVGKLLLIRSEIEVGDGVATYDKLSGILTLGIVQTPYAYQPNSEFAHWRGVTWVVEVHIHDLSEPAKKKLYRNSSIFEIEGAAWQEVLGRVPRVVGGSLGE